MKIFMIVKLIVLILTIYSSNSFALSSDGFYTQKELQKIYDKKYKNKIPYNFGLATLSEVKILKDGSIEAFAVPEPTYYSMPILVRMKLEQEGLKKLKKSYCKKVLNKKTVSKIRSIKGSLKNKEGKIEKTIVLKPSMCRNK